MLGAGSNTTNNYGSSVTGGENKPTSLRVEAQRYFKQSVSKSTINAYKRAWSQYVTFSQLSGVDNYINLCNSELEDHVVLFATHCASQLHLSSQTIKGYMSGISFHYLLSSKNTSPLTYSNGLPFRKLDMVLKGIKRTCGGNGGKREPITLDMLCKFIKVLKNGLYGHYVDTMLAAVFCVAFFGFLRCGEFTTKSDTFDPSMGLCIDDLKIEENRSLTLHLKASKTDVLKKKVWTFT